MEVKRMKVKVCLIGEAAVGKTSLIRRFVLDNFDDKYIQTLGTKVSKKELVSPSPDASGELKIDMTIWDIMGQKGFRELLKEAYFYGAREILANKIDLKDQIQISEDDMTQAARAYDSPFHFTSAKAGVNVETAFQSLAERVAKERYARKVLPEE